jgi:hypothetical protein
MDDKEALNNFVMMLKAHRFTEQEKDTIKHAIGILSWTTLRKGVVSSIKNKQNKRKFDSLR